MSCLIRWLADDDGASEASSKESVDLLYVNADISETLVDEAGENNTNAHSGYNLDSVP